MEMKVLQRWEKRGKAGLKTEKMHVKLQPPDRDLLPQKSQKSHKAIKLTFHTLTKHIIRNFSSNPNGTFHLKMKD